MSKFLVIAVFLLCNVLMSRAVTVTRNLPNFDGIDTSAPFPVLVDIGPNLQETVSLTGQNSSIIEWTNTVVDHGTLRIFFDPPSQGPLSFLNTNGNGISVFGGGGVVIVNGQVVAGGSLVNVRPSDVSIRVSARSITSIFASGSGSVSTSSVVDVPGLILQASGSGDVVVPNIRVDTLQATITGSGSVTVAGVANGVQAGAHGSGGLQAVNLQAKSVNALISGSGSAVISVERDLMGSVSGAGSIQYRGNPHVSVQTSGVGRVSPING